MGKRRLLLVVMLVGLIGLVRWGMPQNFGFSMMRVNRVVHQLETRLPDGQDQAGTPVEKIAAEHPLHKTYYYHFAGSVPVNVRPIFEEAVAVYNKTGLVKLIAGKPQQKQNGITFFTYHKETSTEPNFLELGEGGPEIRRYVGLGSYTINRARAGLNLSHPEAGIRASVAIHELGHAIGLEHSKSRRSIMYPLDQGHERLSAADQKTLRVLYAQNG